MYCKTCGAYLDSDSGNFCPSCGSALTSKTEVKQSSPDVYQNPNLHYTYDSSPEYRISQLKSYVKILGIVQVIIGVFSLFGSVMLMLVRNIAMRNTGMLGQQEAQGFYMGMGLLLGIGVLMGIFAVFAIISGIGLLYHKKWSKISTMIIAALVIVSFPIGTIFGATSFYYLTKPEIKDVLVN